MYNFAFFGTSRFAVIVLEDLKTKFGIIPSLLITQPDKPVGRKQIITPPETKVWAEANGVDVLQPNTLKDEDVKNILKNFDFFVVASYGKIIPEEILNIPSKGAINIHPSLLPKYRGASPIQNQILNGEKEVGTTIMLMDSEVDHGPILGQKIIDTSSLLPYEELEEILAHESAELFENLLPKYLTGEIKPIDQDHSKATFTEIISKEDGKIKLDVEDLVNYRKYLAFHSWPKVYFFKEIDGTKKRNIITEAEFENGKFKIKKIIPEGKNEMTYHSDN